MPDQVFSFDETTQSHINEWLNGPYDEATKEELKKLIKENPQEALDSFYQKLSFGTGGLRGIMGIGCNRMNEYTVRAATQGLACYLKKMEKGPLRVLIGYDTRLHSQEFANEAAKVLASNEIEVLLFKNIRPVPIVSFGVRYKNCHAGIMITASHNPPKYNGYKVYWSGGGQVLPPHDKGIIEEVGKIQSPHDVLLTKGCESRIHLLEEEIDQAYLEAIQPLRLSENSVKNSFKIVYTSLHGTGIAIVPQALKSWGFTEVSFVPEQIIPDGNFPTCTSPNPEEASALRLGIHTLLDNMSDILIATDPDADRLGVVVRHQGEAVILTGNEIASICAYFLCRYLAKYHRMPPRPGFIKTIVTTELLTAIVESHHYHIENVLTGFKYVGEKIDQWQSLKDGYDYIFGGEESYGYLYGTHARDKDAVISALLVCDIARLLKKENNTLVDLLYEIYRKYGIYREKLASFTFPGKTGSETMKRLMQQLRANPPRSLAGVPIVAVCDYQSRQKTSFPSLKKQALELPSSDVLLFWLQDKSKLVIRPSGTEPKIKVYCGAVFTKFSGIERGIEECDSHAAKLIESLKNLLKIN